jgi:hypothetical protein
MKGKRRPVRQPNAKRKRKRKREVFSLEATPRSVQYGRASKHTREQVFDDTDTPMRPPSAHTRMLAKACDGLRLTGRGLILTLRAGCYSNGRLALTLDDVTGAPWDKVTVNLVDLECDDDAFFIQNRTGAALVRDTILYDSGLFITDETHPFGSGFVHKYAYMWRFAKVRGIYCVEDAQHLAKLDARVQEEFDRRKADDAERRLAATTSRHIDDADGFGF